VPFFSISPTDRQRLSNGMSLLFVGNARSV
jgi:hypothetical protein